MTQTPSIRKANRGEVAQFFDVNPTTVDSWVRKGCPVVQAGSRGVAAVFDLRAVAEWHFGGQRDGSEIDPDAMSPQDRRAWFDSEMKKRELQVRDGDLVQTSDLEEVVATAFAACAQDMLAIPDRLERSYGVPAAVAAQVERGVCAALEGLAERLGKLAPVEMPEVAA